MVAVPIATLDDFTEFIAFFIVVIKFADRSLPPIDDSLIGKAGRAKRNSTSRHLHRYDASEIRLFQKEILALQICLCEDVSDHERPLRR
jgi:hypothetical protein